MIKETKHTPAPWIAEHRTDERSGGVRIEVRTSPENEICDKICRLTPILEGSSKRWAHEDMSEERQKRDVANARLIAAAPELLVALEASIDFIEAAKTQGFFKGLNLDEQKKAIAKAKGE